MGTDYFFMTRGHDMRLTCFLPRAMLMLWCSVSEAYSVVGDDMTHRDRILRLALCLLVCVGVAGLLGCKRSEEHTSELQSRLHLVCRLLLEKKKKTKQRDLPVMQCIGYIVTN